MYVEVVVIEVKLEGKMPNDFLDIVKQLKEKGYVQGIDFDFSYTPAKYEMFSIDPIQEKFVIFTFYKDEIATWFSLIYH